MRVSVLIMAGGNSERMKTPKPFLLIDGKSFIERISDNYVRFGIRRILIVLNEAFVKYLTFKTDSVKWIRNHHPELGRLYSLQIGLRALPESDFIFIHNVDNPFVEQEVLKEMWIKKKKDGFVVPVYNCKGGHPILISRKIADGILRVENSSVKLSDILSNYKRIEVEVDSRKVLTNINTWEEYEMQVLNLIPEYYRE